MAKLKVSFVCQECGYDSPQYLGKCPECGNWNSFKEFKVASSTPKSGSSLLIENKSATPKNLSEITASEKQRIKSGYQELDTVLGGGMVKGSAVLLAGDPGVGKSTLLLQAAMNIAEKGESILYVSAEESDEQIKLRAMRINPKFVSKNFHLLSTSDADAIIAIIQDTKPGVVIIDSIQTVQSSNIDSFAGSVAQIRYAAASFIKLAKSLGIPTIMVGHVTKEGMVAGPMLLSHMVDTVLFFEGEKLTSTRILRSLKNRFGPIDEVGVFIMEGEGITEVKNPEQIFLTQKNDITPGSVMTVIQEGSRAFLLEIQALVAYSKLPMPRRVAAGIDHRRLELLLAVLQKHCRLPFETYDVFVNVAGGLKVTDPAADLAICLALFSSLKNIALPKTVGVAEVGLLGELRGVAMLEKRIKEAKSLGLSKVISHKTHKSLHDVIKSLDTNISK